MRQYGLIGYPLEHSFSKGYFTEKFLQEAIGNCHYENYPLESIEAFPSLCAAHPEFAGLNVTIPYKKAVMAYLDEVDEDAERIGAVNTIRFRDGKRKGFNTDVLGFTQSLQPMLPEDRMVKALILGTGGASGAVAYGLECLGIPFRLVSSSGKEGTLSYDQLSPSVLRKHHLIINTTPLGMYPKIDTAPGLPYDAIGEEHILYDLVYNPGQTLFLKEGSDRGAKVKNGLEMLHIQAECAWEIWTR